MRFVAAFPIKNLDADFAEQIQMAHAPENSYQVAVSGGRDSMALLHFLHRHGYRELTVVHVHHGLREEEADSDEEMVRSFSRQLGYSCVVRKVDVASFSKKNRLSIEEAARELRYNEFAKIAQEHSLPQVFLAHHADDQVETLLFRFFRGSGSRGLSGMLPFSRRNIAGVDLELLRPWLQVPREGIDAYVSKNEVPYRDDSSNEEEFSLRNRIRHRLIPTINEVFERDVRGAVLRTAELARRDEACFEEQLPDLADLPQGNLEVALIRELPPAIRDRVLLRWLRNEGVPDIGFREVERVVRLAQSSTNPGKENLPGGIHIRRRQGLLFLEFPGGDSKPKT